MADIEAQAKLALERLAQQGGLAVWLDKTAKPQSGRTVSDSGAKDYQLDDQYKYYPPVTAFNMRKAMQAYLGSEADALIAAFETKDQSKLTPQQKAFYSEYNRFMEGAFKDVISDSSRELGMDSFSNYAQDGILTNLEHRQLFDKYGFTPKLKDMGPLAEKFIMLTGGVVNGGFFGRGVTGGQYQTDNLLGPRPEQLKGFDYIRSLFVGQKPREEMPVMSREAIEAIVNNKFKMSVSDVNNPEDIAAVAIGLMRGICGPKPNPPSTLFYRD